MSRQIFCPVCKSEECRRSRRHGPLDYALSAMGSLPWRCRQCDARFRVWKIPPQNRLLAHCPRCGNINVERVARKRVEGSILTDVQRWMNFPAYRCDPCRHKFFSLRPLRPDAPESQGTTETASPASAEQPQAQASQKQERTPAEKAP